MLWRTGFRRQYPLACGRVWSPVSSNKNCQNVTVLSLQLAEPRTAIVLWHARLTNGNRSRTGLRNDECTHQAWRDLVDRSRPDARVRDKEDAAMHRANARYNQPSTPHGCCRPPIDGGQATPSHHCASHMPRQSGSRNRRSDSSRCQAPAQIQDRGNLRRRTR